MHRQVVVDASEVPEVLWDRLDWTRGHVDGGLNWMPVFRRWACLSSPCSVRGLRLSSVWLSTLTSCLLPFRFHVCFSVLPFDCLLVLQARTSMLSTQDGSIFFTVSAVITNEIFADRKKSRLSAN